MTLPVYSCDVDNETVDMLGVTIDGNEQVIELDFVIEAASLREMDEDGFELAWDLVRHLLARGPALDALEG